MRGWLLAAGLLAAAAASPARAADIYDAPPPPKSGPYGGYYDDPRYPKAPPPSYYDDDDGDYDDDRFQGPPAKKYSHVPPPKYGVAPRPATPPPGKTCVRSEQVRERLTSQGWRDFHDGQTLGQTLVTLRARRPSGRLFELTLHRCTGEVVDVRPLQLRPFGPYAYRQPYGPYGPWRWGQELPPYGYEDDAWQERPYAYRGPRRWYGD